MGALLAFAAVESIAAPGVLRAAPSLALAGEAVTHRALTATELRLLLPGLTLTGEYADGSGWSEHFAPDGRSRYTDGTGTAEGRMTYRAPGVCFTYGASPDLSGGCFEVWRRGRRCFDFYGEGAMPAFTERRFGRGWTARAWLPGGREDCETDLIS